MLYNNQQQNNGNIDFSISKGKSSEVLLAFLDESLPGFKADLNPQLKAEDDISQECSIFLNREARDKLFLFHFQHKYPGKKRTSDFSIISAQRFSSKAPLMILEAKRLPTPGHGRAKEYVEGNLGGIERFKRKMHGAELNVCIMLGYVQKNTFTHWFAEINSWINDLIQHNNDYSIQWQKQDLLNFESSLKHINKYYSNHARPSAFDIKLIHYWLYI